MASLIAANNYNLASYNGSLSGITGDSTVGLTGVDIYSYAIDPTNQCFLETDDIAAMRAIDAAIHDGVDIVNMSFGTNSANPTDPSDDGSPLTIKADSLHDAGILAFVSSGNLVDPTYMSAPYPVQVASPATGHKVLAVGAYSSVNYNVASPYTRYGIVDNRIKPDISAPSGTYEYDPVAGLAPRGQPYTADSFNSPGGLIGFTGTSAAAPVVAGFAALLIDYYGYTPYPMQIYSLLIAMSRRAFGATSAQQLGFAGGLTPGPVGLFFSSASVVAKGSYKDVTAIVGSGMKNLKVAIWWPENRSDVHANLSLVVYDQGNTIKCLANTVGNVAEKCSVSGALASTSYRARVSYPSGGSGRASAVFGIAFVWEYN